MLIGISGRARVGKDTVGEYLAHYHHFVTDAFANSLKRACREIFGLTPAQLNGDLKEVKDEFWGDTPRHILQLVGTECIRKGYDENIWVQSLRKRMLGYPADVNYCVTDIRFPNEANAIHDWGGKLVLVSRPGAPHIATPQHASETSMKDYYGWDYALENNGDLPQLYANIEIMMSKFKE